MDSTKAGKAAFNSLRSRGIYFELGWQKLCGLVSKVISSDQRLSKKAPEFVCRTLVSEMFFGLLDQFPDDVEFSRNPLGYLDVIRSKGAALKSSLSLLASSCYANIDDRIRPNELLVEFDASIYADREPPLAPYPHPSLVAVRSLQILDRWQFRRSDPEWAGLAGWAICLLGWSELASQYSTKCKFCPRISRPGLRFCKIHAQGCSSDSAENRRRQFKAYRHGLRATEYLENIRLSVSLARELDLPFPNILQLPYELMEVFALPDLVDNLGRTPLDDSLELDYLQLRLQAVARDVNVNLRSKVNFNSPRRKLLKEIVKSQLLRSRGNHNIIRGLAGYHILATYVVEKLFPVNMHHSVASDSVRALGLWRYLEHFKKVDRGASNTPLRRSKKSLEKLAEAFRLAARGHTQQEIAKLCDVSHARVSQWRRENYVFDTWMHTRGGKWIVDKDGNNLNKEIFWRTIRSIILIGGIDENLGRVNKKAGPLGRPDVVGWYEFTLERWNLAPRQKKS